MIEFPYYSEAGRREPQEPLQLGEGLTSRILQSREPLVLNSDEQFEQIGTRGIGTQADVLARRPDPGRRRGDRRHQRPELHRGGPVRRRRRAPARDARGERRRRDPECPARSGAAGVGGAYRLLVEELPLAIYTDLPDATSTSVYASPGTEAMFGYPVDRGTGRDGFFNSVLHPDDRDRIVNAVDTNLEGTTQKVHYEYRIIHADGARSGSATTAGSSAMRTERRSPSRAS